MNESLHILYQDDWLVAVDKPAGQLVHSSEVPQEGDLVTMKILRDQIGKRVYNIHRIDRPTTGLLLFAINRTAARALHSAFERRLVRKTYWAVVYGKIPADTWECHEPVQNSANTPARDAHTSFRVLDTHGELALLEATPHTGRNHQIRKHLLHAGIPIVGDYRYAGIEIAEKLGQALGTGTRMLLQSQQLAFKHPITGENISITAPPDPMFVRCFPALANVITKPAS